MELQTVVVPRRPGVASTERPKAPSRRVLEAQPDPGFVLKRNDLLELPPIFGTSVPPRGLSGAMRRAAYRVPDHDARHRLLLLVADRIDAIENDPIRALRSVAPIAIGAGLAALRVAIARRR